MTNPLFKVGDLVTSNRSGIIYRVESIVYPYYLLRSTFSNVLYGRQLIADIDGRFTKHSRQSEPAIEW